MRVGYMRGESKKEGEEGTNADGGGMVSKDYQPARYYDLVVERGDERAAAAAAAAASGVTPSSSTGALQQLLLLVDSEGGKVSMCPTAGNVKVKKLSRATGAKPVRGVKLTHRGLNDEEKEKREERLMAEGVDEEAAAVVRN